MKSKLLKDVFPEIEIQTLGEYCFVQSKYIGEAAMRCIAAWSSLELSIISSCVSILGESGRPLAEAVFTMRSSSAQFDALEAAIGSKLDAECASACYAALSHIRSLSKYRNKLAHWTWGWSPSLPESTLLLIDPKNYTLDHISLRKDGVDIPASSLRPSWRDGALLVTNSDLISYRDQCGTAAYYTNFIRLLSDSDPERAEYGYKTLSGAPEIKLILDLQKRRR